MKKHLVMLHGFGCDSRVFSSLGHKLSKNHDVLMVDIPGHGQTKEMFGDFSFSALAILHALDVHLKEPYHLLGWSMGGEIALEMFKQKERAKCKDPRCSHEHEHGENPIGSLMLLSTTPRFVASDDFKIGMNPAVFNKFRKGIKNDYKKTMDDFYARMFSDAEDAGKYLTDLRSQTPSRSTLQACMESFERFDERKALPLIEVPVLILAGDKDAVIDPKASMYLAQEIKGSTIRVLQGAGHAPHLTREAEVISELEQFLG